MAQYSPTSCMFIIQTQFNIIFPHRNLHVFYMPLFKATIVNAQKNFTLFTLNKHFMTSFFSSTLFTFSSLCMFHRPSLSTFDITFLFLDPRKVPISWRLSCIRKFSWVLTISPPTSCLQLVIWRFFHANVWIHDGEIYQEPQQVFPPLFWFPTHGVLHT